VCPSLVMGFTDAGISPSSGTLEMAKEGRYRRSGLPRSQHPVRPIADGSAPGYPLLPAGWISPHLLLLLSLEVGHPPVIFSGD